MLTSLLSLNQTWKGTIVLLRDLSQDVHCQLGDIDQEIEMDNRTNFAVVTLRAAAPTVLQLILHQSERELDDADWVIARVKADTMATLATQTGGESPQLTQREGHAKSVCTRLGMLVNTFHELVQTTIPIGPCTEQLMKVLNRTYGTLTSLVKYYLSLYGSQSGGMSARFEKLVKLSGTNLTQQCYSLISYIQLSENEKIQHAAPEKGKKKKQKDDKKKNQTQTGKSTVMKQSRTIPNLIFAIEQYERYLIQLSKKSKVNLMEHMKHSTSRDFRINANILAENQEDSSLSSDNDDDDQGDDNDRNDETAADQTRTSDESEGSDRENEANASNIERRNEEPVKKKSKLRTGKKRVGKAKT